MLRGSYRRVMYRHRLLVSLLLAAELFASGCAGSSASTQRQVQLASPPAPGSIIYSVYVDLVMFSYEEGRVSGDGATTGLTETDHRAVRAASGDGRLIVLSDYHAESAGLYVRWQTRAGRHRTHLITGDVGAPVAICGDTVVYVDQGELMRWERASAAPRSIPASMVPHRLSCSPEGRIAALGQDGTLMIGDTTTGLGTVIGGPYTEAAWSPTGRLAACALVSDGQGELILIDHTASEGRRLAPVGGDCQIEWAPDGRHIAATSDTGRLIVACTCASETPQVLANEAWGSPTWSPDGTAIAYGTIVDLRVAAYPGGRSVVVADEPADVVAWVRPPAARRLLALADPYPCCGS